MCDIVTRKIVTLECDLVCDWLMARSLDADAITVLQRLKLDIRDWKSLPKKNLCLDISIYYPLYICTNLRDF